MLDRRSEALKLQIDAGFPVSVRSLMIFEDTLSYASVKDELTHERAFQDGMQLLTWPGAKKLGHYVLCNRAPICHQAIDGFIRCTL